MLHWNTFFRRLMILFISILVMGMLNSSALPFEEKLPGVSLASSSDLFSDDFNDGNADDWTTSGPGTWSVDNYEYVVDIGGGTDLRGISLAGNTAWTDYIFELDLKADEGASKIILFRYIDENNYYSVGVIGLELYDIYKVNLVKVEGGVGTTVLKNDYPHDNSVWHHVTVTVQGNHITAAIDGDLVIDYTDSGSSVTHGKIGLQGFTGSIGEDNKVRFDNVVVRELELCSLYLPVVVK